METIIITGGTGKVGKYLIQVLKKQNYNIIVFTTDLTKDETIINDITYKYWEPKHLIYDKASFEKASYVINLAGAGIVDKRWDAARKVELVKSRTVSGKCLVHAMASVKNNIKAVINASGIGWYGADLDKNIPPMTEDMPAANDFLSRTCVAWENSVQPVANVLNTRLVILRFGLVLMNDGGFFAELQKPINLNVKPIFGTGRQIYSWIHIDDLCNMIVFSLKNEKIKGVYNAVAPQTISAKEYASCAATLNGNMFTVPIAIPETALKVLLGEMASELTKSCTVSAKKIIQAGFKFKYNNINSALTALHQATEKE